MTGKRVKRQQNHVRQHYERTEADPELVPAQSGWKGKRRERVFPEKNQKQNCEIQKVTVDVLQNERKRRFASVIPRAAFADRTSRRVQEKRAVVCLAVVVAGYAKP